MKTISGELERLITEGGFSGYDDLFSLALAIGVFNDVKGKRSNLTRRIDLEKLSSYSLSAIIIDDMDPGRLTIDGMAREMEMYLAGGLDMMMESIKDRSGIDALKEIVRMTPL